MIKLLLYILFLPMIFSEQINIANCNELWEMSNTMNQQTLYAVKIFSCITTPDHQLENINTIQQNTTQQNITQQNITQQNITQQNTTQQNTTQQNTTQQNTTHYNSSNVINKTSHYSPSPSPSIENISPSPTAVIDLMNDDDTEDEIGLQKEVPNENISPSSKSKKQTNSISDELSGLTIGLIVSSSIVVVAVFSICAFIKWRKNRISDNNQDIITLKNNKNVPNTKPHNLNTSQISSKTDETSSTTPQPPLPEEDPLLNTDGLPPLPNTIPDLESGRI